MTVRRAPSAVTALAAFVLAGLVTACAPPAASPEASSSPSVSPDASASPVGSPSASVSPSGSASPSAAAALPDFPHVWIIVLENQDYGRVVGAAEMPYLNDLIVRYGLAERSTGVARPSQPNYFALFTGSTHDVRDNDDHDIDAPTVADQIEASGRTWREYAENRPPDCFAGTQAEGGRDGQGEYRRKHAPAISFDGIRNDSVRCANLVDFSAFHPEAADYSLIIPNQCHSGHDCQLAEADDWLAAFVPDIIDSAGFASGGLLIVTFDEDAGDDPGGGHIATVLVSQDIPAGFRSDEPHDHYSVLRTIEDAWGLGCLAESCPAKAMDEFFTGP
jgi:phosphatidylinositol-3-phosphatase